MPLQLYIHFPFCKSKCFYCDFCSAQAGVQTIAAYCRALRAEMRREAQTYGSMPVSTVFFGGGTPSIVPPGLMADVLDTLRGCFSLTPDTEFTSEANPGTLTEEWLRVMTDGGMNRLSLGVQAAQDDLLRAIGRIHTFDQAREAVDLARRAGIRNLNLDVISGLPGQTPSLYLDSLQKILSLGPEHISAYSLILEEGTPLYEAVEAGRVSLPSEDDAALMYEQGIRLLEDAGYVRYEISNFAKPGCACRHNLGYWNGAWYLGLGAAAHSMLPEAPQGSAYLRRANLPDTQGYICALNAGQSPILDSQAISPDEAMFETLMLGLRTVRGIEEGDFQRRHGVSLTGRCGPRLDALVAQGLALWAVEDGRRWFRLTERGLEIQNDVLLTLMDD